MKFGLNFFPSFRLSDMSTADYYEQSLGIAQLADQLGYSSIKTVEHYFYEYGGHSPNPIVFLAAMAARTQRIRLITGAVIPAFNNPFKLAGELAMLDNLSRGRLDAGFGRAFLPREFDAYHLDMDESRGRFDEGIALIKRLWTEDNVTHEGQFYQLRDIHLMPRPYQKPHPPIWIASVSTRESFIWAGRQGYHLMIVPFAGGLERTAEFVQAYRIAWREAGHPTGAEQVQMSFHCYLANTHDDAIEGFKRPIGRVRGGIQRSRQLLGGTQLGQLPRLRPGGGCGPRPDLAVDDRRRRCLRRHAGRGGRASAGNPPSVRRGRAVDAGELWRPRRGGSQANHHPVRHEGHAALAGHRCCPPQLRWRQS